MYSEEIQKNIGKYLIEKLEKVLEKPEKPEKQKELLKSIPTKLLIDQLWDDENYVLVYPIPIEYIAGIINKPSELLK